MKSSEQASSGTSKGCPIIETAWYLWATIGGWVTTESGSGAIKNSLVCQTTIAHCNRQFLRFKFCPSLCRRVFALPHELMTKNTFHPCSFPRCHQNGQMLSIKTGKIKRPSFDWVNTQSRSRMHAYIFIQSEPFLKRNFEKIYLYSAAKYRYMPQAHTTISTGYHANWDCKQHNFHNLCGHGILPVLFQGLLHNIHHIRTNCCIDT